MVISIHTRLLGVPTTPTRFSVTVINSEYIMFSWDPVTSATVSHYIIIPCSTGGVSLTG